MDKLRVSIKIIPHPVSDIMLTERSVAIVEPSGFKDKTNSLKVGDHATVGIEALNPCLKFNVLTEDFFLFGCKTAESSFAIGEPYVRSIFISNDSCDKLKGVASNSESANNERKFEIRIEAIPYEFCSETIREKNYSYAKAADYKKGFSGLLRKGKDFFKCFS